jgi:hypothetical protein
MAILDDGWTEEQAKGLLDELRLAGGTPKWKSEHLQKLRDWCSANEKDSTTVDAQVEFVAYELCNSHEDIGRALKQANTKKEAQKAVEPYVRALAAQTWGPKLPGGR